MGMTYKSFMQKSAYWVRTHTVALLLLLAGISGAIYFGSNLVNSQNLEPVTISMAPPVQKQEPQPITSFAKSEPVELRISKLGVNTGFVPLGLKADGTMEVPSGAEVAGWYKNAPTPGELGPAVIVGHVDSPKGPAVFWKLRELQPGDTFEIDRADGRTVTFRVDKIEQFSQDNFPSSEVYGNINHAGIRLITCGGTFDRTTRHYSHNTVVFGSLVK